ncbi:MAG: hypothetical protein LBL35_04065 [Clostridiales bacterium]|jgi:hypothetical protein|nr:hypothetical protein [Clostridiales bacterium]
MLALALKIILALAALIIVIAVLALFSPFRYSVRLGEGSEIKASWFLGALKIRYVKIDEQSKISAKILFFKPKRLKKSVNKTKKVKRRSEKDEKSGGKWRTLYDGVKNVENLGDVLKSAFIFVRRTFASVKPRMFKIYGEIGFDDPSVTGLFMAILSVIMGAAALKADIIGRFDGAVSALNIYAAGEFTLFSIARPAALFVFSKEVWPMTRLLLFKKR